MADAEPVPHEIEGLGEASRRTVYPHVFENADREVGGVLVGRAPASGGAPRVTGAIEAIAADERRATLTFTQDAWEHVHRVLDRDFPGQQIVGWYHSHPGFGIFLSEHDLFIHRNFFSGPAQIALVVDPVASVEGVFHWNDGEIEGLFTRPTPPGWTPSRAEPRRTEPRRGREATPPRPFPLVPVVVAGVVGLMLGFLVGSVALSDDSERGATPAPTPTAVATQTGTAAATQDPASSPPPEGGR